MKLDDDFLKSVYPAPYDPGQPPWLLSFADFVGCLLACFVLLFSMVSIDKAKLNQMLAAVPGRQYVDLDAVQPDQQALQAMPTEDARNPSYLVAVLKSKLDEDPVLRNLRVDGFADRVILSLTPEQLAADLEPGPTGKSGVLVYALGGALQALPNEIVVDGAWPAGEVVSGEAGGEWRKSLLLAYRVAAGLENVGVAGPILARAHVAGSGAAKPGVQIIIMDQSATLDRDAGASRQ
jgi:hypothetical protein